MDELNDIITPVDERVAYKEYELNRKIDEASERRRYARAGEYEKLLIRRAKIREIKNQKFLEQTSKQDRDILMSGEDTTEYNI